MASTDREGKREIIERFESLCRAGIQIHSAHELLPVLQTVADVARDTIGAKYSAIGVLDPTRRHMAQFITSGITESHRQEIGKEPEGHGLLGLLIADPKPIRTSSVSAHPASSGIPLHHPHMETFLGVPIRGRGGIIGNLYITEKLDAPEFSADDETIAVMLASQAAVAIENARLFEASTHLVDELRSMQQARDRLSAMINHELRNALTGVYGWAELLLRKLGADAPRAAHEIFDSAETTLELLNDLLDLSRMEADKMKIKLEACDAVTLAREAARIVEPAADARQVIIAVSSDTESLPCHTDPKRVRQILVNLLSNGVRHGPSDDRVSLVVQETGERVRFDVIDRGEGIPPEEQENIFEAFNRAASRSGGTGLGLTLSRGLARLLGGDLRVQSRIGKGARFMLELPRGTPNR